MERKRKGKRKVERRRKDLKRNKAEAACRCRRLAWPASKTRKVGLIGEGMPSKAKPSQSTAVLTMDPD